MRGLSFPTLLVFAFSAFLFAGVSLVRGDDDPVRAAKLLKAHDQLSLAMGETDPDERVLELKKAKDLIYSTGKLGKIRQTAVDYIDNALQELKDGDPYHGAFKYIQEADRTLGF